MHFDAFDRYHETNSFVHRLDPRIKVAVTVAFILSNALLPDGTGIAFGLSWMLLLFANIFSNLGIAFTPQTVVRRAAIRTGCRYRALRTGNPLSSFHFLFWDFTITDIACCALSAFSSVHGFRCRWRSCSSRRRASRISSMRWNICAYHHSHHDHRVPVSLPLLLGMRSSA